MDDSELLAQYVQAGSHDAFGQLVARHLAMVHASVRRQIPDPATADDVTQAVFIILARRASSIKPAHLTGWLLKTAHYAARDAMKRQHRRNRHEQQAAPMNPTPPPANP